MAASSKPTPRGQGKCITVILVGLLGLCGFLSYSYWTLSFDNAELTVQLSNMRIQKKDADLINFEIEKNLAAARTDLNTVKGNVDQLKKQMESKDAELAKLKTDYSNKQAEAGKLQTQLNECNATATGLKTEVDTLKNEKTELNKQLTELKGKPCDLASCANPIKEVLVTAAKLVGSDALRKALTEAKLDSVKLLEGMEIPTPADVQKQQAEKEKEAESLKGQQDKGA